MINWTMGGALAAWLSIIIGFGIYIYRRGKKDGEVSIQLNQLSTKIEKHICEKNDFVLKARCDELSGICQENVETTTSAFEKQVTMIHSRLNAMDSKRDDAGLERNKRFEKLGDNVAEIKDNLTSEMTEIKEAVAGLKVGVDGYQHSLAIILKKYLEIPKT